MHKEGSVKLVFIIIMSLSQDSDPSFNKTLKFTTSTEPVRRTEQRSNPNATTTCLTIRSISFLNCKRWPILEDTTHLVVMKGSEITHMK